MKLKVSIYGFFLVCHLNVGFGLFSRTKIKSTQNSAQTLALLVMATQINTFQFYLHHFIICLCVLFAIIIIQLDGTKMTIYWVESMRWLQIMAIDFESHAVILKHFNSFGVSLKQLAPIIAINKHRYFCHGQISTFAYRMRISV